MILCQLQGALARLLATCVVAAGVAILLPEPMGQAASEGAAADGNAADRVDQFGDPLPKEAISRLGTTRLRHGDRVGFVGFLPDGKTLLSQALDGVRTWELATGKAVHVYPRELTGNYWGAVHLSADGRLLVSASASGVHVWDAATAKLLRTLGKGEFSGAVFSPDARLVAALRQEGGRYHIAVFDTGTGEQRWSWEGEAISPTSLTFARDGKSVIAAGGLMSVQIPPHNEHKMWSLDAATGKEQWRLDLGTLNGRALTCSPDGTLVAGIFSDGGFLSGVLCIWSAATGKQLHRLAPVTKEGDVRQRTFSALTFTPDGKALVTAGGEDGLTFWDTATGKELRQFARGTTGSGSLAFSRDGKQLAVASASAIRLIDLGTEEDLLPTITRRLGAYRIGITPDGRTITTGAYGAVFSSWDALSGRELRRLEVPGLYDDINVTEDGRLGFTRGRKEKGIRVWDIATDKERPSLALGEDQIGLMALTPDGKTLALVKGYSDTRIHLLDLASRRVVRSLTDPGFKGYRAEFTTDGKTLFVFCDDQTVQVWDVATGTKQRQFGPIGEAHPRGGAKFVGLTTWHSTKLSPDARWIAGASDNGKLALFDAATGQLVHRLENLPDGVPSVFAFSPDSRMLAWVNKAANIHFLEVATGQERYRLGGHNGVWTLAFTADGNRLVSGEKDTTAVVWDLTGRYTAEKGWGKPLKPADLDACWADLAGADAARAYRSMRKLAAPGSLSASYLGKRVPPAPPVDAPRIQRLIADLDSTVFGIRAKAAEELEKLGELAAPACRKALAGQPALETRRRLEAVLEKQAEEARRPSAERLRVLRVLEVLERARTPKARQTLMVLAKGAPEARLTLEAKAALQRLGKAGADSP